MERDGLNHECRESGGGFIHPSILSPPTSTTSSSGTPLPRPRHQPLKLGSSKETAFINYVDKSILHITRRYAKKFGGKSDSLEALDEKRSPNQREDVIGYNNFKEVGKDISKVVDMVWVSGTPTLQVSYLLSLALLTTSYIPSFPPAPKTMFQTISKLDYAFASLVQGQDVDSGEILPGFTGGKGINDTDKVRIKSLIESTRVRVVEAMDSTNPEEESDEENDIGGDVEGENIDVDDLGDDFDMDVARVYAKTLNELGDYIEPVTNGMPNS